MEPRIVSVYILIIMYTPTDNHVHDHCYAEFYPWLPEHQRC